MPIPRYKDEKGKHEPILWCDCGYAISLGKVTRDWEYCPLCSRKGKLVKLKARKVYYPSGEIVKEGKETDTR